MTAPTDHYLTIKLGNGKSARARVAYLQPKAERRREASAVVHILCSEWLEPYWYSATYTVGSSMVAQETFAGKYMPIRYKMIDGPDWLFIGSFEGET